MVTGKNGTLLHIKNLSKAFPGVQALDQVNLEIFTGEVHGLMGENGAGKSTLMKILCGVYHKDGGEIVYLGKNIDFVRSHDALVAGIIPVYQELSLCENMTVAENIFIHRQPARKLFGAINWNLLHQKTRELLNLFQLDIAPDTLVADLPVSIQQQVEILKALSLQPRLVILDEPTSSLGLVQVEILFKIIRKLKEEGASIIYIAHNVNEVIEISDRISVLRDGRYVGTIPAETATESEIIHMMVGRTISSLYPELGNVTAQPIFEVRNLSAGEDIHDINFKVFQGEILGFSGLVGAGRTKMAKTIFGMNPKTSGEVYLDGQKIAIEAPQDAIKLGVGYIPKDRKLQGLFLDMAVPGNVVAAKLKRISKYGFLDKKLEIREAEKYVGVLNIKTSSYTQEVNSLSGGNQQKVLLAKWLSVDPKVLIVDEPTRGIDIGTKSEIHQLLRRLAAQGVAIMMISSELLEILGMSDRIMVMHEGRIIGKFLNKEASQRTIMECISQSASNKIRRTEGA